MEKDLTRLEEIGMELMYCRFSLQKLVMKDRATNEWENSTTHLSNIHKEERRYHDGEAVNTQPIENAKQYIKSREPMKQMIKK